MADRVEAIKAAPLSTATTRFGASTEVDENGGWHLTRLPRCKQIPCETEAGVQLELFTSPFVNLVRTQFLEPDFVVTASRR